MKGYAKIKLSAEISKGKRENEMNRLASAVIYFSLVASAALTAVIVAVWCTQ